MQLPHLFSNLGPKPSTNQPINQSTNQPINQSTGTVFALMTIKAA